VPCPLLASTSLSLHFPSGTVTSSLIFPFWTPPAYFPISFPMTSGEELGSFGALVASNDVTFAIVSDTTAGVLPGSYRAESYCCLSILRFLNHFMVYHKVASRQSYNNFYCDNLGLIMRLKHATGPLPHFPHNYLRSDMDLKMQITFPRQPNLGHCHRRDDHSIRDIMSRTRQLPSFQRHYPWNATHFDHLDWPFFRSLVSLITLEKRCFFLKWPNDLLPIQARRPSLAS
jgi:hypothetical protein